MVFHVYVSLRRRKISATITNPIRIEIRMKKVFSFLTVPGGRIDCIN